MEDSKIQLIVIDSEDDEVEFLAIVKNSSHEKETEKAVPGMLDIPKKRKTARMSTSKGALKNLRIRMKNKRNEKY